MLKQNIGKPNIGQKTMPPHTMVNARSMSKFLR